MAFEIENLDYLRVMAGERPNCNYLAAYVPMLAADLRTLRDRLEQIQTSPKAITNLDDIITDYIKPMEKAASIK